MEKEIDVTIRNFGSFQVRKYNRKKFRNPKTGEICFSPPKKKIHFIQQLMDYFQEREEYERCAELLKIQKEVTKYELDNRKSYDRRSGNRTK